MHVNNVFCKWQIACGVIKRTALCAAALLLLSGCSGGFGTDSENASEIGPGIFEPDTGGRRAG